MTEVLIGICDFCKKKIKKNNVIGHSSLCDIRIKEDKKNGKLEVGYTFQILVEDISSEYWLFLECDSSTDLSELDFFLRYIWLDCCSHMSAFNISNQIYTPYESLFGSEKDKNMDICINDILKVGTDFHYIYDMNSTTQLQLKVLTKVNNNIKKPIILLARNLPIDFKCHTCDKKGTMICICYPHNKLSFCKKCYDKHSCNKEYGLPILNSPRVGVCNYNGEYF